MLLKNKKIATLHLTPTLNLTPTLTLTLILTQTQNLTQILTIIKKNKKEKKSTHSLLSYSLYGRYVT